MAKQDKDKKVDKKGADSLKVVKKQVEKILELLDIKAKVEVSEDKENEAISVQIESEEPGVIIGRHGETIQALQLLLGMIVSQEVGEWTRVLVNVGNWRETREETLKRMAAGAAQKAHFSGEEVALPPLSAPERRIIHLYLSENPDVTTESQGEGALRQVIVKPVK